MLDLTMVGGSNGGSLSFVDGSAVLTSDGTTADPTAFSAQYPCLPGVTYSLTAAVSTPQGTGTIPVSLFVAYFGDSYVSGDYPPGPGPVDADTSTALTITFAAPGGLGITSLQALVQLSGLPDPAVQLVIGPVTLTAVPAAGDTYAVNSVLTDGAALITWPDRWDACAVLALDSDLWVSTDPAVPAAVGADDVDYIPVGSAAVLPNRSFDWHPGYDAPNPGTVVSLASASTSAAYSVEAAG